MPVMICLVFWTYYYHFIFCYYCITPRIRCRALTCASFIYLCIDRSAFLCLWWRVWYAVAYYYHTYYFTGIVKRLETEARRFKRKSKINRSIGVATVVRMRTHATIGDIKNTISNSFCGLQQRCDQWVRRTAAVLHGAVRADGTVRAEDVGNIHIFLVHEYCRHHAFRTFTKNSGNLRELLGRLK